MVTATQVQAATTQFVADVEIAHQIVHGGTSDTVVTEGGTVPSLAGSLAQGIIAGRNTGTLVFATRADLYAWETAYQVLPAKAEVWADTTAAYNGVYQNTAGGTGSGAWTKIAELPGEIIHATDSGAGTANAIKVVASRLPADGSIMSFAAFEANTDDDVTVEVVGGSTYTIKTVSGAKPFVGDIVAGMTLLGRVDASTSTFRLVSDISAAAIQAAAEAAAQLATDYATKAEDSQVETGTYSAKHWAAKAEASAVSVEYPVSYGISQSLTPEQKAQALTNLGLSGLQSALVPTANLSDLADMAVARANLGLGTAAVLDAGTGANQLLKLDGDGKLPAIDGSLLTELPGSRNVWQSVTRASGSVTQNTSGATIFVVIRSTEENAAYGLKVGPTNPPKFVANDSWRSINSYYELMVAVPDKHYYMPTGSCVIEKEFRP